MDTGGVEEGGAMDGPGDNHTESQVTSQAFLG